MTKVDEGNLNNIHTSSNHKVNWFGKSMIFGSVWWYLNLVVISVTCVVFLYKCVKNWLRMKRQWDDIW